MVSKLSKVFRLTVIVGIIYFFVSKVQKLSINEFKKSDLDILSYFGYFSHFLSLLICSMLIWSLLTVLLSDPGSMLFALKKYGEPDIETLRFCEKCHVKKPARCHHCSDCNSCILFMDHHCDALGVCLGYRNYKAFLLFNLYITFYSGFATVIMFMSIFISDYEDLAQRIILVVIMLMMCVFFAFFTRIYFELRANNRTTIESLIPSLSTDYSPITPAVFTGTISDILPTPIDVNPFLFLSK